MDRLLVDLGLALGLGLLVGLQRERADQDLAGIRTFGLITLLGGIAMALGRALDPWAYAALALGLAVVVWSAPGRDRGVTTEISAIVMFGVGGVVVLGQHAVAVALTGVVALLLHWKQPLHAWARRLDDQEMRAVMRMVLIGLVILPALPDTSYGPFQVLNPFRIWLIVVLIVGISIGAFVVHRMAGPRVGTLLAGVLGGLISSTATAVSYARRTREHPGEAPASALVLMLSSTVVFLRIGIEVAVVAPSLARQLLPPLAALMGVMILISLVAWRLAQNQLSSVSSEHLPSNLRAAVAFGLLYAAVLVAVAAAQTYLGAAGLYSVALLSGLTDVDAITLSTAEVARRGLLDPDLAWRLIAVGSLSNLAFKAAVVAVLGPRALLFRVLAMFGLALAAGLALVLGWPAA